MNVYCAHAAAQPYGIGGYLVCGLCGAEWYAMDAAPIIVLGYTEVSEIPRYKFLVEVRKKKLTDS